MAIVIFEHSELCDSRRLGAMLRNHGHRLDIRRLHRGDPIPVDLDNVDGIITCGGPQSANDDSLPWLAGQMHYLESAHRAELPIVALCLGSQILARALGGTVETMEAIEFGWHPVHLTSAGKFDIVHAGVGWTTWQFHHHRDWVSRLPDGAQLLASSPRCAHQVWSLGLRTYAFQTHPEIDLDMIHAWCEDEPEVFDEAGITREELETGNEAHYADFERITDRIFERIALLVMPADRRVAGLAKEIHH